MHSADPPFSKTLLVWWRFGKEHGGDDLRQNAPEVIDAHLQSKIERFRETPQDAWRWWQVDRDLIVERPPAVSHPFGEDTRIYYLLDRGVSVIENVHLPPPDDRWKWYIHVSDFIYDERRSIWLMKDLFCDILIEQDNRTYHLFDLPDMAQALDVGLISPAQSSEILRRIAWIVTAISKGDFPILEILRSRASAERLGW